MAFKEFKVVGDAIIIKREELVRYRKVQKVMQFKVGEDTLTGCYHEGKEDILQELINLIDYYKKEK